MSQPGNVPKGPPYAPRTAGVGGLPTIHEDVPITSVFLFLYVCAAVGNMFIFQRNRRRKHFFIFSALLFGFCMARILTCTLRIVWATRPHDVQVSIASNIFNNAGILLVYIINLLFAHRILCARQPEIGWNRTLHLFFVGLYIIIGTAIALVISMVVWSVYTLNEHHLHVIRDIELAALTYFICFVALPPAILILTYSLPRSPRAEHFGSGPMHYKTAILALSSGLCIMVAGFRAGTNWATPRPINNPAWWDSKASFYCFGFMIEILILINLFVGQIDQRFHMPNGSNKRKTYRLPEDVAAANEAHANAPRRVSSSDMAETDEKEPMSSV